MKTNPLANPSSTDDVLQDADYKSILGEYQRGNWDECAQLFAHLEDKYPGNSILAEFKRDFDFKHSVINTVGLSAKKEEKRQKIHLIKIIVLLTTALIGVFLTIWFGSKIILDVQQQKQIQENAKQINILNEQVGLLLDSGQFEKADELLQRMKAIDPTSPKIIELTQKKDLILKVNVKYLDAMDKLAKSSNADALNDLMKIQIDYPGYKDVPQLIESTTNKIIISQAITDGTADYDAGRWQGTIDNFEKVLSLDPETSDPNLKGLLINSYLHQTIVLLEKNDISVADINRADLFFSQAIAMIPQSKVYFSDREELGNASSNLLEQKLRQASSQMVEDPAQTEDTIYQAFVFIRRAYSLDQQDTSLRSAFYQMVLYRDGFQYYADMDWRLAIGQFSELIAIDQGYANGYARKLLFEAHFSLGAQYYSVGSYEDARREYEIAESLAPGDDNLMSAYLARINLGITLGKMNKFKDADSYFNKAIQSINYQQRGMAPVALLSNLQSAVKFFIDGQFETSYHLFSETLVGNDIFYELKSINARQGNCLALIAAQNQSAVQPIIEQNGLPPQTILASDQILLIPYIP